jgi:hypothetical protein
MVGIVRVLLCCVSDSNHNEHAPRCATQGLSLTPSARKRTLLFIPLSKWSPRAFLRDVPFTIL